MSGGTTIVDRLNKLSGKDATTIAKALENLEEGGGIGGFEIHICTSAEYDSSTLVPTVTNPDASTLYLVPTSFKSKNMFDEYVWTGTDWEKFGTGSVALPSPTTADNGKVLGVDGGEYKLVEQSGGGTVEVSTIYLGGFKATFAEGTDTAYGEQDLGKTLREIIGDKKIVGIGASSSSSSLAIVGYAIQVSGKGQWLPNDQESLRSSSQNLKLTYYVKRAYSTISDSSNVDFELYCI